MLRTRNADSDLEAVAERIRELSRGAFLANEREQPWLLPLRDRLKARVTRVVLSLGQGLEQAGKAEAAIELYRRALEQDNLAEELYRRVITCHAKLGQRAEAMAAYRRCRELLSIVLGIQPSAETERLFRAIQAA
jgi:DNA-binding SARP family transcriptional activator